MQQEFGEGFDRVETHGYSVIAENSHKFLKEMGQHGTTTKVLQVVDLEESVLAATLGCFLVQALLKLQSSYP